ncbi:predicted altronate dehydratase [Alteracholeplasma palmae J233]|uniref:Predicted altronate dehydratase n=1 Tax=Alteracholeplasma palmae (strain ATCC 49389 / J233) TaxID=1318466 RepID=U4KKF9_ALTPJ|nr:altronate dehydratase family protein [Alteracholeplasma palmae]CCV64087.1 predicted altronate dehydratase [Alteracholeplasma palmae J233]
MSKFLIINPNDNVMVSLEDVTKGSVVNGIEVLSDIVKGHKIALRDIKEGEDIVKYGSPIGHATEFIPKGAHVHVHNVKTNLGAKLEYDFKPEYPKYDVKPASRKINVYKRKNGDIGIRNELWIVPTVGCIVGQARQIANAFAKNHPELENYDGIHVFGHPFGCSQMGDDHVNTRETLQNISLHPNAGGVLILGLGCENNQIKEFKATYEYDSDKIKFLAMQEVSDEIEAATEILEELYENLITEKRSETDISELRIGLKCGGSDGFSGITANPLLGKISDYITYHGGTSVLTEVPEMFGAEKILMRRAKDEETFHKIVNLINDFKGYYEAHNQVIYENPSPGNKNGGITTLEDKSLGCTQKGGQSIVCDVLKHTQRLKTKGLNLISAPGNDLVSVTTLGMSGAHLVLFSTGRGTPFGGFIPTIKVSTNTDIYERKPKWIDFNAGSLVDGVPMDDLLENFVDFIVEVVNGKKTNNEKNDFREIAIFKDGVIL